MTRSRELAKILTDGNLTGTLDVTGIATANAGVKVDNITIDGTEIDLSSGDLTLDVAGDIILDADGGDVNFQDGGTIYGFMSKSSDNLLIGNAISDGDVLIRGNDGGSNITALTLDMSDGGRAAFAHNADFVDGRGIRLGNGNDFQLYHDGTNNYINGTTSTNMLFLTNGSERMRIDSSGRVGIFESSPAAGIHITSTNNALSKIRLGYSTSNHYLEIGREAGYYRIASFEDGQRLVFGTSRSAGATTERMRIDADGNVGIGVSTVNKTLHISKSTTSTDGTVYPGLQIENTSAGSGNSYANLVLHGGNATTQFSILADGRSAYSAVYLRTDTASPMLFLTNGSERMRIDTSGNMGILNTSPSSYGNATELVVGNHSINDAGITIATTTNSSGRFQFADNTASPFRGALEYSHTNDAMTFYTAGSARMRITSGGLVGIGTNSPDAGSVVTITHTGSSVYGLRLESSQTSGTQYHLTVYRNTTHAGYLTSNAALQVALYNASDERLKENIVESASATQSVKNMKVRQYNWKSDKDTTVKYGFVAQELITEAPEAVIEGTDEKDDNGNYKQNWSVSYNNLVPRLVKTIQEQQATIEALTARITTLENA